MLTNHPNKLLWKCRRGMLELDLIFTKFYQEQYLSLTAAEQKIFEQLLDEPDPVLWDWLFNSKSPPNPMFAQLIKKFRA